MRRGWLSRRWAAMLLTAGAGAVLTVMLLLGAGNAHPAQDVRLLSGSAWLASAQVGQVTLLDGSSAEVAAQVKVASSGDAIDVVQQGSTAFTVNRDNGVVTRVDGSTFVVSPPASPIPDARGGLRAFAGTDALYALDTDRGVLAPMDAQTLAPRGAPLPLSARLADGGAVLDNSGTLWLIDDDTGDLTRVAGGERTTRRQASQVGRGKLTLVNDTVVLVDTGARTATTVDRLTGEPDTTVSLDLRPDDQIAISGSPHGDNLYLVTSRGVLTVCDLALGSECATVVPLSSANDELGAAVEAGHHVLVPDYTTGRVWIVDLTDNRVLPSQPVLTPPGPFQLLTRDGVIFYNDPNSERAGVLRLDGTVRPAAKYDPADPDKGLNAPPSNVPPQGTSAPETTTNTPPTQPPPTQQPPTQRPRPPTGVRPTGVQPPGSPPTRPVPTPTPEPTTSTTTTAPLPPVLRITLSAASPVVNTDVTLRVDTTTGEVPAGAQWDFGDGSTATAVSVTHRWTAVRTYQVSVVATMADGRQATTSVSVAVTDPPSVAVPNVVGQSETAATQAITAANLLPTVTRTASNTVPAGQVISQSPTGGTSVQPSSQVTLTVSSGPRAPFDFIGAAGSVQWRSAAGPVPFNGGVADPKGFAVVGDHDYYMEDNNTYRYLETHPQWVDYGYIEGTYTLPAPVIAGDHFRSQIGFILPISPPSAGDADFVVSVVMPGGGVIEVHRQRNLGADGVIGTIDVDLTSYVGAVGVRLRVDARETAGQDWACWIGTTLGK